MKTDAFQLLADEDDFIIINKMPDISVHKDQADEGLIDILKQACGAPALYQIHRLDKMTSGLLVYAKSYQAARLLSEEWQSRSVSKYYLAISDKKPSRKQGLVKGDMVKSRGGSWRLQQSVENPAITQFFSTSLVPGIRAFLLRPHTGRTHQIRVAMKSLGSPILGDTRYASAGEGAANVDRGYLHAYQLGFELKGRTWSYQATPTEGMWFTHPAMQALLLGQWQQPGLLPWPVL
ncbi:TIGR01621 family pseudouridine synthase [Leeia oryzae]|uniref:TIGR01621 family pseudouridine synthase n=1 Tax=Leeia oryzae TaxID=356662 RepID=UPI000524A293|nr:TIGR01621 family pseudouridine synthase [Leeia oryzae]